VGEEGGGDEGRQLRLIWSLQLKLGIPGSPREIAADLFDRSSPTFAEGRIGGHRVKLPSWLLQELEASSAKTLTAFGYAPGENVLSGDAETWRRRPYRSPQNPFLETPILIETNFMGHNIVSYRGRLYGVPAATGTLDLSVDSGRLTEFPQAQGMSELRAAIALRPLRSELARLDGQVFQGAEHAVRLDAAIRQHSESSEAALAERTQRIAALEAALAERSDGLAMLEQALGERNERLLSLERAFQERDERLGSLERTIQERNERLVSLERSIDERNARLNSLEGAVDERNQRVAALEATVAERDERLKSLESSLEERTQRLQGMSVTLSEDAQRLASLESTVDERTQRIGSLEAALAERDQRLRSLESQLFETDNQIGGAGRAGPRSRPQ
jgi:septal ring factor EnvC (AmiA/AmiB activator)